MSRKKEFLYVYEAFYCYFQKEVLSLCSLFTYVQGNSSMKNKKKSIFNENFDEKIDC